MSRLFVIGNGFDLEHDLPTSYNVTVKHYSLVYAKQFSLLKGKKINC